jgi:hypothetical protein
LKLKAHIRTCERSAKASVDAHKDKGRLKAVWCEGHSLENLMKSANDAHMTPQPWVIAWRGSGLAVT